MAPTFDESTLSQYDGREGRPAYVAYRGKVYDVTDGPNWVNGEHINHLAGVDLTEQMDDAPHGDEALEDYPVVGDYV